MWSASASCKEIRDQSQTENAWEAIVQPLAGDATGVAPYQRDIVCQSGCGQKQGRR